MNNNISQLELKTSEKQKLASYQSDVGVTKTFLKWLKALYCNFQLGNIHFQTSSLVYLWKSTFNVNKIITEPNWRNSLTTKKTIHIGL